MGARLLFAMVVDLPVADGCFIVLASAFVLGAFVYLYAATPGPSDDSDDERGARRGCEGSSGGGGGGSAGPATGTSPRGRDDSRSRADAEGGHGGPGPGPGRTDRRLARAGPGRR